MELDFNDVHTAEDLFQLLCTIPPAIRSRLPLSFLSADGMEGFDAPFSIEAYEVTETEGEIVRGFRFSPESN